jgi:ADP-heptose:LPS heptosyltransferase
LKVAIVKPDHLGDLVLSVPAIRAAEKYFGAITLFVSERCRGLAHFLFPNAQLQNINFPHLARSKVFAANLDAAGEKLEGFDLVLWLRNDPFIHKFATELKTSQDFIRDDYSTHEAVLQKEMLLRHLPNYSRTELFGEHRWPENIKRIGLSIGSGFPTNQWPMVYWVELAAALTGFGVEITLIAGPAEQQQTRLLNKAFPHFSRTVVGSDDYARFLDEISNLDLIIATDGGTGHLCSLAKPMLSIFASSPWRRFAPFGKDNVVITRDLSCSPCCNFSMAEVNGCMTRECSIGIYPDIIASILIEGLAELSSARAVMRRGTSHAIRPN